MLRILLSLIVAAAILAADNRAYVSSIEEWRRDREAKLKGEDGWLSLAGLFWLEQGENTVGSVPGARVRLPSGFAGNAGSFLLRGNTVSFRSRQGAEKQLRSDKSGDPDIVPIGRLRLHVIERGSKLGIRLKDPQSRARTHFRGLRWFPVSEGWRVAARFIPDPRQVTLDAQAGGKQQFESPGYVEWERAGRQVRLRPVREGDQLFFIFRDGTSGKSTYGAARFIYTELPKDGRVLIDFNKAYNPPCVFTPYATCPLPPPENRLRFPIEAGEKMYDGH